MNGLMRHLARSKDCWGRRVLILIDSMAALGVVSKGRSSCSALLRLSRQICAVALAFSIYPVVRYIPSEVNPADGPSRGVGVGAADETRKAHADRLHVSLGEASPAVEAFARARGTKCPDHADVAKYLAEARACSGFAGG